MVASTQCWEVFNIALKPMNQMNQKHDYYISNNKLSVLSDSVSDLGIVVTNSLSWSKRITKFIKKANLMIYLLTIKPTCMLNSSWNMKISYGLILQREVNSLGAVQRWATRILFGRIWSSYPEHILNMKLRMKKNRYF